VNLEPVETAQQWSKRFLEVMPVGSLSDAVTNAIVEYQKSAFISDAIVTAINGTPVPPSVAIRESSFLFALVTNGGNILDVIAMVEVGLLSRDSMSTFAALKKTWESENGV
jgi:hypothetical protein